MERVSEESLRANLTYLASDELEGRHSPSTRPRQSRRLHRGAI